MRADIEPRADVVANAMQDQRFGIAIEHHFDFREAAVLDLLGSYKQTLRSVIV